MRESSAGGRGPVLFFNPADDHSFVERVRRLMAAGVQDHSDLERRLRGDHPLAVVRPRDLADESVEVWYVYRDGHWVPS